VKVYEEQPAPASTKRVCVKTICDLCGTESQKYGWDSSIYERNETEISVSVVHEHTESYGDSGFTNKFAVDLCPDCFQKELIPWLKSRGAQIQETEFDW
jgi:hypothetical protein